MGDSLSTGIPILPCISAAAVLPRKQESAAPDKESADHQTRGALPTSNHQTRQVALTLGETLVLPLTDTAHMLNHLS